MAALRARGRAFVALDLPGHGFSECDRCLQARGGWKLTDGLAALDCELLIVASVDDERFDVASARDLAQRLPGCSLAELVGLDHRASARDPSAVETMVEFLT